MRIFALILAGICICMLLPALTYCTYLYFITVYSLFFRKTQISQTPQSSFALFIPLTSVPHNLQKKIVELKAAIDYPDELYEIITLTDNINSEEVDKIFPESYNDSRIIRYCNSWRKGKEFAIEWALSILINEKYDAFLIIDETVSVSPWLLKSLNAYISSGADAVQVSVSRYKRKMTWLEHLKCITSAGYYHLRPKARNNLGISCGIQGTGFCMTKKLLNDLPFQPFEYKNWFEYHIKLVCNNNKVVFIPKSGIKSTIIESGSNSEFLNTKQKGKVRKRYISPLLKAVKHRNPSALDCLITLFSPSLTTTIKILSAGLFAGFLLSTAANVIPECHFLKLPSEIVIILTLMGQSVMIFYFFVAIVEKKLSLITCLAGFFFPVYILYSIIKKSSEKFLGSFRKNNKKEKLKRRTDN